MWILLALLSAILYATTWLLTRATRGISSRIVTATQFIFGPFLFGYFVLTIDFPWDNWIWNVYFFFDVVISPLLLLGFTFASQRTEIGIIKPLTGLSSIAALFFSIVLFHETFSPIGILGILITTAGLFLLYHGRWHVWHTPYPWFILVGVIIFGANTVLARQVLQFFPNVFAVSSVFMVGGFSVNALIAGPVWFRMKWTWKKAGLILLLAVIVYLQDILTLGAAALAPAPYVLAVKRLSILIAALGGYYFFNERDVPLPRLLAAVALVIGGIVFIAFH